MNKEVPKSTQWARENKARANKQAREIKTTLRGKLTNLITTSKYRAKIKGIPHSVNTQFLYEMYQKQEGLCALTGKKMIIRGSGYAANSHYSISLDRIDSSLGYTEENVWLVCTGVNLMKSRMSMDEFIHFCVKVAERFQCN